MALGNFVFVVTMMRWGDPERHSYVVGAFSNEVAAISAGEVEKSWRGGKYDYRIDKLIVDQPPGIKEVEYHKEVIPWPKEPISKNSQDSITSYTAGMEYF